MRASRSRTGSEGGRASWQPIPSSSTSVSRATFAADRGRSGLWWGPGREGRSPFLASRLPALPARPCGCPPGGDLFCALSRSSASPPLEVRKSSGAVRGAVVDPVASHPGNPGPHSGSRGSACVRLGGGGEDARLSDSEAVLAAGEGGPWHGSCFTRREVRVVPTPLPCPHRSPRSPTCRRSRRTPRALCPFPRGEEGGSLILAGGGRSHLLNLGPAQSDQ